MSTLSVDRQSKCRDAEVSHARCEENGDVFLNQKLRQRVNNVLLLILSVINTCVVLAVKTAKVYETSERYIDKSTVDKRTRYITLT